MIHLMPRGREVAPLQDFFNSFFEGVAPAARSNGNGHTEVLTLPIDVAETKEAYVLHASLPGFQRDQIEIRMDEGVLSIKAEMSHEKREEGKAWLRRERRSTSVARRIALPNKINEAGVSAELKDGVLTLTLPKLQEESSRIIKIS